MRQPIVIPDEHSGVDSSDCLCPLEYEGHFDRLLIKRDAILAQVRALAKQINDDYKGRRPILVCVLKGANPFYQHLLDALMDLKQGFYTEFMRVSSYEGTSSTGKIQIGGGLRYEELNGKDVILVEDIVDTGTTLSQLVPALKSESNPRSIEVCSLLTKRLDKPAKFDAKYVGFSLPNVFIVGYGLDYNELYRDCPDIWVISQKGIDFDPKSWDKM